MPGPAAIKPSPGFPQPTSIAQQPGQFPRKMAVAIRREIMTGGKGDGKPDAAFNRKSLSKGVASELEHTSNPAVAKEIAKDHLTEDRSAYEKEGKFSFPYKIRPSSVSGQECLDEIEERFMTSVAKKNSGSTLQAPMTLGGAQKESQWQTHDPGRSAPKAKASGPVADALFGTEKTFSIPEILGYKRPLEYTVDDGAKRLGQGIGRFASDVASEMPPFLPPPKPQWRFVPDSKPSGASGGTGGQQESKPALGAGAGAMVESKPGMGWGTGAMLGAGALAGAGGLYAWYRHREKKKQEELERQRLAAQSKSASAENCAEITPLAAGFFISCRASGYSLPQVREFTKIASETDKNLATQLAGLDDNFWRFVIAKQANEFRPGAYLGNTLGNWADQALHWGSQLSPVAQAGNVVNDYAIQPMKKWMEGNMQQGAANEVSKRMDALGFDPNGGIGKFMLDYNKQGLMSAIGNAWGNMSRAQQASLLAMIGGPLIGAGTAMAGHPGLGAMIGLGGLAAGGAGMYFGGNKGPKPFTPTPMSPQTPTPTQTTATQPVQLPQAGESDWTANQFRDAQRQAPGPSTVAGNQGGQPGIPSFGSPPTSPQAAQPGKPATLNPQPTLA